jgi:hypothetical protein
MYQTSPFVKFFCESLNINVFEKVAPEQLSLFDLREYTCGAGGVVCPKCSFRVLKLDHYGVYACGRCSFKSRSSIGSTRRTS